MRRVVLRGLAARKLRSTLTAFAVVLGVALVSGSYIMTDTIEEAYASVLTSSYDGTDAVVTTAAVADAAMTPAATGSPLSEELLDKIAALPEVDAAAGTLVDFSGGAQPTTLLDRRGVPIDGARPTYAFGVDPRDERFNPLRLTHGRWAAQDDEIVIDSTTAQRHGLRSGQRVSVMAQGPVQRYTIVGLARYRTEAYSGGFTTAVFTVETAQRLHRTDGFSAIAIAATPGVARAGLVEAIHAVLPAGVEVRTGRQQASEELEATSFVGVVRYLLVAFGGVALLVGAFVIVNTLSMTVAQRTRELATLRTLGATRRQVRRSVVLEGLVMGVVASLVGLAAGFVFAEGLRLVFDRLGVELPDAPTVFRTRTALVSLTVGIVVTFLAALVPAVRATRVPPLAALRDSQLGSAATKSRRAARLARLLLSVSAAFIGGSLLADDDAQSARMVMVGAAAAFIGTGLLAPRLVQPVAALLARPLAAIGGPAARLARDNAVRNPARTAATAAALMIGVTLATFASVVANAVVRSGETAVRQQVRADYIIASGRGSPIGSPEDVSRRAASAPGVTAAASIRTLQGGGTLSTGQMVSVTGVDAESIASLYRFSWTDGNDHSVTSLGADGTVIARAVADTVGVSRGDAITMRTPEGTSLQLHVRGVFEGASFDSLLGEVVIPQTLFSQSYPPHVGAYTLLRSNEGAAVERFVRSLPSAELTTPRDIAEARHSELMSVLRLLYVLLALAVLVSVLGMVNTLVLVTYERTREIGMLRAVGMTRRNVRRMICCEGMLTALIGATLGVLIGLGAAASVVHAADEDGLSLSVPVVTLATIVVGSGALGLIAAAMPAQRASRMNVLEALRDA